MGDASDQSTSPLSPRRVTGLILAGGTGRRMEGQDKGLLDYQGRTLINYAIDLLTPHVSHMVISANRNLKDYAAFGYPVIKDAMEEHQGPLAGIAAGMATAKTDYILVIPCDSPALPHNLASRLYAAMDGETQICFAATPEQDYPTIALLRRSLLPELEQFLARGERKARLWYREQGAKRVEFPHVADFINLNTPAELNSNEHSR